MKLPEHLLKFWCDTIDSFERFQVKDRFRSTSIDRVFTPSYSFETPLLNSYLHQISTITMTVRKNVLRCTAEYVSSEIGVVTLKANQEAHSFFYEAPALMSLQWLYECHVKNTCKPGDSMYLITSVRFSPNVDLKIESYVLTKALLEENRLENT